MWRILLRPDVLFLFGTLQGLLPYLLLSSGENPISAFFQVSYYPIAIWIIGYGCFVLGTRVVSKPRQKELVCPDVPVSMTALKRSLLVLLVFGVLEMAALTKVYGGVPLLAFASGQLNVNDANDAQAQSGFGQIGAAALTVTLLVSVTSLLAIKSRQTMVEVKAWVWTGAGCALLMSAFGGKRQGALMCIVTAATCSTIALGNPMELVKAFLPQRMKGRAVSLAGAGVILLALQGIAGLATLRNPGGSQHSALDELEAYYFFPMMNFSLQCVQAGGFGPSRFHPMAVAVTLLPAKTALTTMEQEDEPPRVEITSPSGFYEKLQWNMGLWGIIPFTMLCGALSQYIYRRAFHRYAALLTYAVVAWALFSAPLYNHFLNLLFVPVPALLFWIISCLYRELSHLASLMQASPPLLEDK